MPLPGIDLSDRGKATAQYNKEMKRMKETTPSMEKNKYIDGINRAAKNAIRNALSSTEPYEPTSRSDSESETKYSDFESDTESCTPLTSQAQRAHRSLPKQKGRKTAN